ncbi:MAG: S41 family peptidase [Pirellulales bacterium]
MSTLSIVSIFERLTPALADLAWRGMLLFAVASSVVMAMTFCRSSAAARHFVWTLAIAASLAIPLVGLVLPAWTMELPLAGRIQQPAPSPADVPLAFAEIDVANLPGRIVTVDSRTVSNSLPQSAATPADDQRPIVSASTDGESADALPWQVIVSIGWALGLVVGLVPLAIGSLSLWRLRRTCRPVTDARCLQMLAELCEQLALNRQVVLKATDRRHIPMTWGIRRPIVLLPREASTWANPRLRAVLLHELAHVQRFDCLTQWIAQLARAVHWFNPLAWVAVRELRREQEQACDDRVLRTGLLAADYAEHLLAVASQRPPYRFATGVALAMARSSRMDRRLQSILDARRNRNALTRIKASATIAAASVLLVPLATATVSFQVQAQELGVQAAAKDNAKSDRQNLNERVAELRRMLVEQYVTAPDEEQVLRGAIQGMVKSLNDPYTEYLPADKLADLQRQMEGKLSGIGAQLDTRDGRIVVITPLEGSPALKAGVQPGDAILGIDDQTTREMKLDDAVKRIVGDTGTKVRLKVRRTSGEVVDLTIERGPIVLRSVSGFARGKDHGWEYLLDREHKIGYLAVSQFGPRTAEEIKEVVAGLQKADLKGLILDLRFSPGGLLQAAYETAQLFLGEGTVVTLRGRDGEDKAWKSNGTKKIGDFPLVVLVGEQTASATEVLAGALKDNDRAVVVGARTFGKGSVQTLVRLNEGEGAIRLTTAFYHSPSGRSIDRRPGQKVWGVDPSDGYFVPMTQEATERLRVRRLQREILGAEASDVSDGSAATTPDAIAKDHGDPQLAAALRTLVARVVSGEFEKVGQSAEAAQEYALRRIDIDLRRAALTRSLEELDREWKLLDQR